MNVILVFSFSRFSHIGLAAWRLLSKNVRTHTAHSWLCKWMEHINAITQSKSSTTPIAFCFMRRMRSTANNCINISFCVCICRYCTQFNNVHICTNTRPYPRARANISDFIATPRWLQIHTVNGRLNTKCAKSVISAEKSQFSSAKKRCDIMTLFIIGAVASGNKITQYTYVHDKRTYCILYIPTATHKAERSERERERWKLSLWPNAANL